MNSQYEFTLSEPINNSWVASLIKKNFSNLRFIDDRMANQYVVNNQQSDKTLLWINDETWYVNYLLGNITKESFLNHLTKSCVSPLVVCEFPLIKKWLDEALIPNVFYQNFEAVEDAITLHQLDGQIIFNPAVGEKSYCCFNGRNNAERQFLLKTLHEFDIIHHGHVTCNWHSKKTYPGVIYGEQNLSHYPKLQPELLKWQHNNVPASGNFLNSLFISKNIPGPIILQCETILDFYFPTEKSHQAFSIKRIPLTIGSQGHIQNLRALGFDVFDDLIDYSYDLIPDKISRIHCAIKDNKHVLTNTIDLAQYQKRLDTNQQCLANVFWKNKLTNMFDSIKNFM